MKWCRNVLGILVMFRTIKLIVAYDGASYVGWQRQENGKSIQAYVEEAIERIEGRHVGITSAGRTDAGVHAIGQVASVQMHSEIGTAALVRALNASDETNITNTRTPKAKRNC